MERINSLEQKVEVLSRQMVDLKHIKHRVATREGRDMDGWLEKVEGRERELDEIRNEFKILRRESYEVINLKALESLFQKVIKNMKVVNLFKDEGNLSLESSPAHSNKLEHKTFSHKDLIKFTSNFKEKVGSGGFSNVYQGQLDDGKQVAVKVLTNTVVIGDFMAEMQTMITASHPNLVTLYGFCFDYDMKALVYEFMKNGSLDKILFDNHLNLEWGHLHEIALQTAKGLAYLHSGCGKQIIHRDVKPSNVLIDENLSPKITDFGLAKLISKDVNHYTLTKNQWTPGYMAPEFGNPTSDITKDCDVYSFGVMLFEVLGKRCNGQFGSNWFPIQVWRKYKEGQLDELLESCRIKETLKGKAKILSMVALWCVQHTVDIRPSMSIVVDVLEKEISVNPPPCPFKFQTSLDFSMLPSQEVIHSEVSVIIQERNKIIDTDDDFVETNKPKVDNRSQVSTKRKKLDLEGEESKFKRKSPRLKRLRNISQIKEDFQDIKKQLFKELIIQEKDNNPKEYDQLLEENMQLKAEIMKMKNRIDELENERRQIKVGDDEKGSIDQQLTRGKGDEEINQIDCEGAHHNEAEMQPKCSKFKVNLNIFRKAEGEVDQGNESIVQDVEILEREDNQGNKNKDEEMQKQAEGESQCRQLKKNRRKVQLKRKSTSQEIVEVGKDSKQYNTRAKLPIKVAEGKGNKKQQLGLGKKKMAEYMTEIVEVKTCATVTKIVEVRTFSQFRNINESRHLSNLNNKEKQKVVEFFLHCNRFTNAYKDDNLEIQGRLLEDLMFDNFTDSEVIDFYLKWLKEHPDKANKCIYVSSLAWTHLKEDRKKCVRRVLHDALEKVLIDDIKYVFFPMNTLKSSYPAEGYHRTLLVLNYQNMKFEHYNSMKPRKVGVDKFYEEAGIMRNEVINWIDQYRAKRKMPKISWSTRINTPKCTQQGTTSDCGLYVCKIMESLTKGEKLHTGKKFHSNVDELKSTLTHQILADKEHSWRLEKMLKNKEWPVANRRSRVKKRRQ